MLNQTIPGTGEANYEARAYGALAVVQLFRLRDKREALELLKEIVPKTARDPQVGRVLDLETARDQLVRAFEEGRISAEELPPGLLGLSVPGHTTASSL